MEPMLLTPLVPLEVGLIKQSHICATRQSHLDNVAFGPMAKIRIQEIHRITENSIERQFDAILGD